MGNQHSGERGRAHERTSAYAGQPRLLTSAEEIEAWLPDSTQKMKAGTLSANRQVDWDDENVVMKETQVRRS